MNNQPFKPFHINATAEDLAGNHGIGRYVLLPGSDGRAKELSSHFDNLVVKSHPRGHHLYLGTLSKDGQKIDVAAISSGMGCPSMEIILHELFHLGGKRFLRVGTAGSLQPYIKIGDVVCALAAVRDEQTTADYAPLSIPAVASNEVVSAVSETVARIGLTSAALHTGTVHCKGSFYAREFGAGPQADANNHYMNLLTSCGVLATEMETSTLFIQSQIYDHLLRQKGNGPEFRVLCGAILGILVIPPHEFGTQEQAAKIDKTLTEIALNTLSTIARGEC